MKLRGRRSCFWGLHPSAGRFAGLVCLKLGNDVPQVPGRESYIGTLRMTLFDLILNRCRDAASMTLQPIHPDVRVGHVHLKVSDLDRAVAFYEQALGFEVTQRIGDSAAFLSAGGYHHHVGLNTWESRGGAPPPSSATGLYHVAFVYPSRLELAKALRQLLDRDVRLDGAADHGVSEALYLRDPDGNGVELYWDRPVEDWPHDNDGVLSMFTRPLDLQDLLGEFAEPST